MMPTGGAGRGAASATARFTASVSLVASQATFRLMAQSVKTTTFTNAASLARTSGQATTAGDVRFAELELVTLAISRRPRPPTEPAWDGTTTPKEEDVVLELTVALRFVSLLKITSSTVAIIKLAPPSAAVAPQTPRAISSAAFIEINSPPSTASGPAGPDGGASWSEGRVVFSPGTIPPAPTDLYSRLSTIHRCRRIRQSRSGARQVSVRAQRESLLNRIGSSQSHR